ncbi:fatty acid desaturase [Rhodoferax lacus]|uniref:Fatty acid desaturase n=1 Tax=Rhodoferax lacus TaxID=2184758 RepID=A0A3E1RDQ5_9BURK|nr:fatty acid desaturase [Rhodoferax lacus]RFO97498.1 fatty acid desaturase [Rhodoferax lacus]
MATLFRYPDGVLPNVAALSFTLVGYVGGLALIGAAPWWANAIGFVLLTQALIWSAYYIHELAHNAIFKVQRTNERWGTLMTWLNGSCYAPFADMRRKHMRHHVERADVITFDVQAFLRASPAWFRNSVLALEWAYFPAVEYLMRGFVIALPFTEPKRRDQRARMLAIIAVRLSAFALLMVWSPKAAVLYCLSQWLFITFLRFADCFQHTYDSYPILDETPIPADKLRDRAYEQANTYSDVVGLNNRWLNLIWLNFGFHNAHHERPTAPWYRLPAFHKELYPDDYAQVITVGELLRSFHINRVKRVLSSNYGEVLDPSNARRADGFLGAVGVSFLTAV